MGVVEALAAIRVLQLSKGVGPTHWVSPPRESSSPVRRRASIDLSELHVSERRACAATGMAFAKRGNTTAEYYHDVAWPRGVRLKTRSVMRHFAHDPNELILGEM
jgi:hypothetical protein